MKRYFGGKAEGKSFVIADAAFLGRSQAALEELRWAMATGVPSTFVTSAFAGSARGPGPLPLGGQERPRGRPGPRGRACRRGSSRTSRRRPSGWTDHGLARAIRAVAQADADIKGAASDASYTLERLVLTIAGLRGHLVDCARRK